MAFWKKWFREPVETKKNRPEGAIDKIFSDFDALKRQNPPAERGPHQASKAFDGLISRMYHTCLGTALARADASGLRVSTSKDYSLESKGDRSFKIGLDKAQYIAPVSFTPRFVLDIDCKTGVVLVETYIPETLARGPYLQIPSHQLDIYSLDVADDACKHFTAFLKQASEFLAISERGL